MAINLRAFPFYAEASKNHVLTWACSPTSVFVENFILKIVTSYVDLRLYT